MIESVTDIALLAVKELHLGIPQNEEKVFDLLTGYVSNLPKLKEMRGFRHILVHLYGKVDNEKVYQHATEDVENFQAFIDDIKKILKEQ